jgi:DNA polymerase-3 subunit alpha
MGPDEMSAALPDYPEAIANTLRIAEMCDVELKLGKSFLPRFQLPEGVSEEEWIRKLAAEGLERRFKEVDGKYALDRDAYRARLEMELGVIVRMGFPGYFLIVQDFINWAKDHDVPVGPGRGSGAGSIVAWSLRITDLDPIRWNLLFERFLNPERVSMPDFDIDFCQEKRERVIQYVRGKYGEENVGQIATFGSLKARSVIRDVVRVMGLPFAEGDRIAKLVPDPQQGKTPPLKDLVFGKKPEKEGEAALPPEPRLEELYKKPTFITEYADPSGAKQVITTRDLLDISMSLEGLNRNLGLHAAGVVIADKPLWEYVPAYADDKSGMLVSQFAKEEVEAAGLVKFDFLGLKTLTVIDDALQRVRHNHPELAGFTASDVPIDDPAVYEMISRGDTAGVFQMESSGFTEMVKKMRPSVFEDIIAAGALYRPGPLDQKLEDGRTMVDVYIDRKHGREKVAYPHPSLEPVLKATYGVIVYQEQVMQISQVLGGYSLGGADLLRRAMGKKKKEEMAKQRALFLEGARQKEVDEKVASGVFDLMEKFAQYGFNKSHSAAYGLLTVQTAWLKAHYPVEFMAALITSEASNTDKVVAHISEARADGIEVLQPDVNESNADFTAIPAKQESSPSAMKGKIRFGLGAVKGVGGAAVEAILQARADGGPFKGLFDFASRVDSRRINKKVCEALVKSGAFDFEGTPRWQLFFGIDAAFAAGASAQADRASGQASLFGALPAVEAKPRYPKAGDVVNETTVEEWPERVRLALEKEALGFYITGHPLRGYEKEAKRYASATCAGIAQKRNGDKVTVVGVVASARERMNKEKGTRFAFLVLEDLTGTVEVACWASRPAQNGRPAQKGWADWEAVCTADEPVLVHAEVRFDTRDEENPKAGLTAIDVELLSSVRSQKTSEILFRIDADALSAERAAGLKALLARHPGGCAATVRAVIPQESETIIKVPAKVQTSDDLIEQARRLGFEVELR